jgi:riboflavin kinase/FMN adenylyltransferase
MSAAAGPALAIGKFDALHLGHRALVERAAALGAPGLLQFSGMAEVLGWPQRLPLVAGSERARVLQAWSRALPAEVRTLAVPFATVRPMLPAQFIDFLADRLGARAVVVGEDFRFGRDRSGDLAQLAALAGARSLALAVVGVVAAGGAAISSSRIRAALAAGEVGDIARCLGRPYRLVGTVVRGDGRGRQLGFPTANLAARENQEPGPGVYAAWAELAVAGRTLRLRAAVNIGRLPTIGADRPITVEAHFLDPAPDCYDCRLALDFAFRLRAERRFASLDELRAQIARDVGATAAALAGAVGAPPPA